MDQQPASNPGVIAGNEQETIAANKTESAPSITIAAEAGLLEEEILFKPSPPPNIDTATLPPPPQTIDEIRAALTKREQQISAIQRLGRTLLIRTTDFDQLMKQTLNTAVEILDADVGSIQLYDADADSLIFRHVFDPADEVLIGHSVPTVKGIDGRVFRSGVSDLTNRVGNRKEWNDDVDSSTGYHTDSMLTVPLKKQDGSRLGVMQVLNGKRPFDQRDLEVLEVLCSQASQAMISAHLYEDAQRRLDHLQALRSIDLAITASLDLQITLDVFVEQVITQLKLDAVNVLLLNPHLLTLEYAAGRGFHSDALRHTNLRLGEGLAGRAALERRVINIPNLNETTNDLLRSPLLNDEGFVTYFAVPLIAKGQIKGVLETFQRTRLDPDPEWLAFWKPSPVKLLSRLIMRPSLMIYNAPTPNWRWLTILPLKVGLALSTCETKKLKATPSASPS
jgi:GAF domain-containing protein